MKKIELNLTGPNGIKSRYIQNGSVVHKTSNQLKIFPFKTNPSGDVFIEDFKSFQGVIGELFRISENKTQLQVDTKGESYKTYLKTTIIEKALEKVETKNKQEFKSMLSNLFFEEDNALMKFNVKTIYHMNFISTDNAIKDLSKFIYDVFLQGEKPISSLDKEKDNILHQLIMECLPELTHEKTKKDALSYTNLIPGITKIFKKDFSFLTNDLSFLLKHIEDFFKYYCFYYFSQLSLKLSTFGVDNHEIEPVYFSLDWETLSESRLTAHKIDWKVLNRSFEPIFAHDKTMDLLNYITIEGEKIGDYHQIQNLVTTFSTDEKNEFKNKLAELNTYYISHITNLNTGSNWEQCERDLENALSLKTFENDLNIEIYSFWYRIQYQFENSERNSAFKKYSKWLTTFAKVNYTKNRGRLGVTTVISQEMLLFLTRLCIGNESKIRLKTLWDNLKLRGIVFDETSKLEITKLFEKINLIEKKSDSGDAQYIKSTI